MYVAMSQSHRLIPLSSNKQDSIEQAKGRSHEKDLIQVFYARWFKVGGRGWGYLGYTMVNRIN
jgi:hypothetical protein